ncbi:helix-turn-helix transcriptional regulator [Weissella confusa]|uniref:helix-turn-helix transcriptional regulator n=1 Tax=Weissella confusa TaxID=1583 RepID=UPI00107EEF37|nr:helix-turn-helix transcriptional regulator [Weissella confusa]TGE57225.1 XRE family transcriptional regulator [Weissella confusa]
MTLFERTKETASNRGLSIQQVAKKAGLGINSIYRWKERNPTSSNIKAVADVLGVSVDYLLGNTDEMHPAPNADKQEPINLAETVDDSERDNVISANGQPISDEDWAIIKAVLAKYPKRD